MRTGLVIRVSTAIKVGECHTIALKSLIAGVGYVSWRKLGDVISSLYALGYHERVNANLLSMDSLREVAFARTFSGDTNVSLFLGRPPRIDRKHCRWIPRQFKWIPDAEVDYLAETQWSAICSVLKGEALDLFHQDDYTEKMRRAK